MSDLKVCLYPQEIFWNDKKKNFAGLEGALMRMHPSTDLLIIPETFSTGCPYGDKESVRKLAERNSGDTVERLKLLARKYRVAIAGSYLADTGGLLANRAFFIEPNGDEYFGDKRHLFSMAGEDRLLSPGDRRLKVRYRGWEIAMVVCYDIRFPVWCRNVGNEYDLLIAVANWPKARVEAWKKLLMARAIENEAYVCGVDCKGRDVKDIEYDGTSMAVDFKGNDISIEDPEGNGLVYATLSLDKLRKFREKFPAFSDADRFIILEGDE
ncbi:MAG: nitrilase family protein [Muribaculaceae bacterium]|nr:nitrilase family protein [Muribaculaceae bacterium]